MGQTDRSDRNMVMKSSGSSLPVFKTIDSGDWHEQGGSNERRYGILGIVGSSIFGSWLILDIKIRISWIHPSVFFLNLSHMLPCQASTCSETQHLKCHISRVQLLPFEAKAHPAWRRQCGRALQSSWRRWTGGREKRVWSKCLLGKNTM